MSINPYILNHYLTGLIFARTQQEVDLWVKYLLKHNKPEEETMAVIKACTKVRRDDIRLNTAGEIVSEIEGHPDDWRDGQE